MRVDSPVGSPKLEVNDIIEVGGPRNGSLESVHDNSLLVKIISTTSHTNSVHFNGIQLSASGKNKKMCDMFLAPATIRRVQAGGRDNVVLSHPCAKIASGRPSGTAWFTCRKSYDEAMLRATQLKAQWESEFKKIASRYGAASLCLCSSGTCNECENYSNSISVKAGTFFASGL